jgi:hypothetical protein
MIFFLRIHSWSAYFIRAISRCFIFHLPDDPVDILLEEI